MPFLITLAIIIVASIIISKIIKYRNNKIREYVLENSLPIKELKEINRNIAFASILEFKESHDYDNEIFYDSISCQDYLIYQLQFNSYKVLEGIKNVKNNNRKNKEYLEKVNNINSFGKIDIGDKKYNINKVNNFEKEEFDNLIIQPTTTFEYIVILRQKNMAGRIIDTKMDVFSDNTVSDLISRIKNKENGFYKDREIWDAICRVERGKVSNAMRFSIYKRDGYRCSLNSLENYTM